MRNILGIVISYIFIALIIVAAKFFEKTGKEASRKFIHIVLCNWWFIAMCFFDHWAWASFVPATFVVINFISYKKNLIQVMERDENKKEGLGTVYYAISLLVISIVSFGVLKRPELGLVPILVMGYGDGLAAIMGQAIKSKTYKIGDTTKSLAGSAAMFIISAIILSIFYIYVQTGLWYLKAIIISLLVTVIEAISIKGIDNFTVPLSTFLLLLLV